MDSGDDVVNAHRRCGRCPGVERRIAIVDEIARGAVPGKRLTELLYRPRGRRVVGDRDVHEPPALVSDDHQYEQQSARRGRHDEEVGAAIWCI